MLIRLRNTLVENSLVSTKVLYGDAPSSGFKMHYYRSGDDSLCWCINISETKTQYTAKTEPVGNVIVTVCNTNTIMFIMLELLKL